MDVSLFGSSPILFVGEEERVHQKQKPRAEKQRTSAQKAFSQRLRNGHVQCLPARMGVSPSPKLGGQPNVETMEDFFFSRGWVFCHRIGVSSLLWGACFLQREQSGSRLRVAALSCQQSSSCRFPITKTQQQQQQSPPPLLLLLPPPPKQVN
jgi:hypothetical protein